jgi:hypothetical protein
MGLSENDGKKITPIEWLIIMSLLKWPYNWGSLIFRQIHIRLLRPNLMGIPWFGASSQWLPSSRLHGWKILQQNLTG